MRGTTITIVTGLLTATNPKMPRHTKPVCRKKKHDLEQSKHYFKNTKKHQGTMSKKNSSINDSCYFLRAEFFRSKEHNKG